MLKGKIWHPDTCNVYCAVMHCQGRCGQLALHGNKYCADCGPKSPARSRRRRHE